MRLFGGAFDEPGPLALGSRCDPLRVSLSTVAPAGLFIVIHLVLNREAVVWVCS